MQIRDFKLERYFADHEFRARYLLSASDCESVGLAELLALADAETRSLWDGLALGYTESQGHPLLRVEIARQYQTVGTAEVLIAAPEEAIFIAMHALLAPGDEVIVTWPAYQSLYEIAAAIGCRVLRWPLVAERGRWHGRRHGGWSADVDALPRLITGRTRLLIINFPHNPTGCLPSRAEFEQIIALARQHGIVVFSDEMYRLLERDPQQRLPSGCDAYERGVTLSGLSKAHGLPGLRIGWLATRDRGLMQRFVRLKDYTTICSSAPSEILALIGLRGAETLLSRNRAIVEDNLRHADRFFARHVGSFEWLRPDAGSVAFPRLTAGLPVAEFAAELLAQRDLMVVGGEMFECEGDYFRLGLGRRSFPAALAVMAEFVQQRGLQPRTADSASGLAAR
jgi:aspartate/methionine/tyrosine aminotransferase